MFGFRVHIWGVNELLHHLSSLPIEVGTNSWKVKTISEFVDFYWICYMLLMSLDYYKNLWNATRLTCIGVVRDFSCKYEMFNIWLCRIHKKTRTLEIYFPLHSDFMSIRGSWFFIISWVGLCIYHMNILPLWNISILNRSFSLQKRCMEEHWLNQHL